MNYYYLVAGLPNIGISDSTTPMSPSEIAEEIVARVSSADRPLLQLYLLKHDNANLLQLLKGKNDRWEEGGIYTLEELRSAIEVVQHDGSDADTPLPPYMQSFLCDALIENGDENPIYPDSRLSDLYYAHALACGNAVIADWFEFCLNVGNLLTAANCRRLELDALPYIIGDNEVARALRSSSAKDWGLTNNIDYLEEVMHIASETDVLTKERQLDELRWHWLENATCFSYFGIERLFCFLVELDIIGRWQQLNAESGEEKLRQMIARLKSEVK